MATKREIDGLISDIPSQVAAAHASVRGVNDKTGGDAGKGPFAGDAIAPSDYGFDMFGETGANYIKERSRAIARQTLKVHGVQPAEGLEKSGVMDGSDFDDEFNKQKKGREEDSPKSDDHYVRDSIKKE